MNPAWYQLSKDGNEALLHIQVKPGARETRLVEKSAEALRIALHAPPREGAANLELIDFLSRVLNLPKSRIVLVRGQKSRSKQVRVPVTQALLQWVAECCSKD